MHRRLPSVVGLVLWATGCAPTDRFADLPPSGPARCKRDLDCAAGEICNPGALRCVEDVAVGPGEFAGSAWYVVAEDEGRVRSGQSKSVYVKARFGDRELVLDDIFAQELLGRWFLNLGQKSGDGHFSMAVVVSTPPTGPGQIGLDDDVAATPIGGTAVLGAHDEAFFVREYVAVSDVGAIDLVDYPTPLAGLDQVRLRFSGHLDDIGPAAYLTYSTPCGTDGDGRTIGLYDGVEDRCQSDFEGTHILAGLDCLYGDTLPPDGGNANFSFIRPPTGPWIEGADLGLRQEGKCQAGIKDGQLLVVAYVRAGQHYLDLEITAPLDRLSEGAMVPLSEVNARVLEIIPTNGSAEANSLGRLGSGTLRVHRFTKTGERPRLYLSVRGTLGGHLLQGDDCNVADDECANGLRCQPGWDGGAWCMRPCGPQNACSSGQACGNYRVAGTEYTLCTGLHGEFQSGCDPNPRRLENCSGALSCTNLEGSNVCVTPCTSVAMCGAGRTCGQQGFCVELSPTYGSCDDPYHYCGAGHFCANLVGSNEQRMARCLRFCPCQAGESCWPSGLSGMSVCLRDSGAFESCSDSRVFDGYRCAPGLDCVSDLELCMARCSAETCGRSQVCAGGYCFRTLRRLAACDESVIRSGYYCAGADTCVRRQDKPGNPSFCYARCGAGLPSCPSGSVCSALSTGDRACLTP